jgi:uncharacterized protein with WD repeat
MAINSRSALVGPLARSLARSFAGASSRSAVRTKAKESLAWPVMKPDYNHLLVLVFFSQRVRIIEILTLNSIKRLSFQRLYNSCTIETYLFRPAATGIAKVELR